MQNVVLSDQKSKCIGPPSRPCDASSGHAPARRGATEIASDCPCAAASHPHLTAIRLTAAVAMNLPKVNLSLGRIRSQILVSFVVLLVVVQVAGLLAGPFRGHSVRPRDGERGGRVRLESLRARAGPRCAATDRGRAVAGGRSGRAGDRRNGRPQHAGTDVGEAWQAHRIGDDAAGRPGSAGCRRNARRRNRTPLQPHQAARPFVGDTAGLRAGRGRRAALPSRRRSAACRRRSPRCGLPRESGSTTPWRRKCAI